MLKAKENLMIGVNAAVAAMGGVRPLARAIGISNVSILGWKRVPAERVLKLEEITGVDRTILRPDLYPLEDYRRHHHK